MVAGPVLPLPPSPAKDGVVGEVCCADVHLHNIRPLLEPGAGRILDCDVDVPKLCKVLSFYGVAMSYGLRAPINCCVPCLWFAEFSLKPNRQLCVVAQHLPACGSWWGGGRGRSRGAG